MSSEQSFGVFAKNRRRELGLTQDELAHRVGCAPITLRKIEADDLRPSVQIAERMAMALNIPLDERSAFVKLARIERTPFIEPSVTPMPAPEEIGGEDLTGRAIRGYALGERIGNGGMGVVYRAIQPLVEREVAVKIILPKFANHPDFIRRFEAEAQLVARLEHPHIVPLYDYWREPSVAYLVMRLLRGGSLQSLLRNNPIMPDVILRLMEQIGSALSAAHRAGVVHRDLKPANVLLDEDNNAYLADFGIAKNLSAPSSETQVDEIVGTTDYISPEQIRSEFVRPQSDIYALGVMLYELFTGTLPFRGPTPFDVMHQHLSAPLPPLAANRIGLPKALDNVLEHATAKDPLARYETVEAMLVDLRLALGTEAFAMQDNSKTTKQFVKPLTASDNPYKGLRAFSEGDAQDFYGREALAQQLLVRLGEGGELARFLTVVGPSGSGKSSVVKAGLVPALRRGALPGSENWFIVEFMPGAHPLEELEAALLRIAVNPPDSLLEQLRGDKRGLLRAVRRCLPDDPAIELTLVIDQFEEVFTLLQDESTRAHFLDLLVTTAMDEHSRVRIILTLRADFIDKPLGYVDFGEMLRQRMELVLPLTPDELERAITAPAERVGLHMEAGLVSAIMRDLGDQPGTLPLLQYALTELFEKREDNLLTKSAYQSIGGVLGALGRSAETIFSNLDAAAQSAARQLFLRLVTLGEGTEDTRRRVLRDEIESLHEDHKSAIQTHGVLQKAIEIFGKTRLLSFDRDPITRGATIEVAHEALLREWTRLREWLNESRADVRTQRQLNHAVQEWNTAQRDASFLMAGSRLEQFEGWSANTTIALTQDEHSFLTASVAERDRRELEEQARQRRELQAAQKLAETERQSVLNLRSRNRVITTIGVMAVVLAILAGTFGLSSSRNAKQAFNAQATSQAEAQSRATAEANALSERNTAQQQSLIASVRELSSEANLNLDIDPELSILLALQAVNKTYEIRQPVLPEAEDALHRAVQASRVELTLRGNTSAVWSAVFSPDGARIATSSADGTVKTWDATTGKELFAIQASTKDGVNNVVFSPDGKLLATAGDDKIARIWDSATGKKLMTLEGHTNWIQHVAFSPTGSRLATASADGITKIWDILTGRELLSLYEDSNTEILWVAFSPDSSQIITANSDFHTMGGSASIWNLLTGKKLFTLLRNTPTVESASFSPDGAYVVTTGDDHTAKIWDAKNGNKLFTLYGHTDNVMDAAFSPDSKSLVTTGYDRQIKFWDVVTGRELFSLAGHGNVIFTVAFSSDGQHIITASGDKTAKVWSVSPSRELFTLVNGTASALLIGPELSYSPSGTRLATANSDRLPKIWDVTTGKLLFSLKGHTDIVTNIAYNANGTRIATASNNGTATIWDAESGKELMTLYGHTDIVNSVAFSPDDSHLATGSFDNTVKIWDLFTGKTNFTLIGYKDLVSNVVFSPDGTRLATSSFDNTAIVWDAITGNKLFALTNHKDSVTQIAFSPDGTRLATSSVDGTAKVWDSDSGKELLTLAGHTSTVYGVAFSLDGKYIATASADKTAKVWDAISGTELLTLHAPDELTDVAFSPDGTKLAVASRDGTDRIYLLHIDDLILLAKSLLTRTLTLEECQQYLHVDACPAIP